MNISIYILKPPHPLKRKTRMWTLKTENKLKVDVTAIPEHVHNVGLLIVNYISNSSLCYEWDSRVGRFPELTCSRIHEK